MKSVWKSRTHEVGPVGESFCWIQSADSITSDILVTNTETNTKMIGISQLKLQVKWLNCR